MKRPLNPVQLLWGLGYIALGTAIAAAIAWPIYQSVRVIVIAAASLILASAVVLLARQLKLRWWGLVLGAILVYVAAVVPLAIPSAFGSVQQFVGGLRDGITGITVGWKQLLTLDLPLGDYQAVLVPLFIVFYLMALVAVGVIVRGGRIAAVAVPAVALMSAFGIAFGSSTTSNPLVIGSIVIPAGREVLLGVALVLLSLIWLIGRSRLERARALRNARATTGTVRQRSESLVLAVRRNALGVAIVAIALVAGFLITPVAATLESRQALRDGVDPLLIIQRQPSPLSSYRSWFEAENYNAELFTVTGGGVDRIRLATLDTYDGETFHVNGAVGDESSRFSRLPRTQPTTGDPVQLEITIGEGYSGIWVPVPNGLAAAPNFTGARDAELADAFYISDASSSAIDVAPNSSDEPGLEANDSYTVYANPVSDDIATLGTAGAGRSKLSDVEYPGLEDWVELQETSRDAEGLVDLIDRLRARGYLSHSLLESDATLDWVSALEGRADFVFQPSYSGHSRARIETLFTALAGQQRTAGADAPEEALVAAIGDDEQFATAGALLARYLGYDSRVVIGVRLESDDRELAVATCDSVCTGANVSAWIEVSNGGTDWVTIDTSPQFVDAPSTISTGIELPENPTIPDEVQSEVVDPPQVDRGNSDLLTEQDPEDVSWLTAWLPTIRVVGLSALAALLLVLPILVIAIAKSSRRRLRRSMRVPEVSVVGAWDELVDSYVDYGVPLPRAASRLEFATATERPAALALATLVDRAVFAEHPPGRDASAASWEILDAERAELAASSTLGRRFGARLSPASFLRHFGPDTRLGAILSTFRRKETLR